MKKRLSASAALVAGALLLASCSNVASTNPSASSTAASTAVQAGSGSYVLVVKVSGITWFQRMEVGVKEWGAANKVNATQVGPTTFSPEQQTAMVQSLIAQKPAAIGIIPADPDSMKGAVADAKKAGIKVVSHEAATLDNADVNIEAFKNEDYGHRILEAGATCMGGKGDYVQFVGSFTSESHMEWAKAEYALQQQKYPDMKRVTDIQESGNKADGAYAKAKQLLQTYPNLKGFLGGSSEDVIGIGRAIKEAGLEKDTCVVGTGVPSQAKQYMDSGAIDTIFLWDPKLAGEAILSASKILVGGGEIKAGTDLGVKGYEKLVKSDKYPTTYMGNAILEITKANLAEYDF